MGEIRIENICKTFIGEEGHYLNALQNITMKLRKGEFVSLIGESGSGKSTLAKIILGLEKPDSGTIYMDGVNLIELSFSKWKKQRKKIQAVFQDASGTLNPKKSIYANIEEAMINLSSLNKEERKQRILRLMEITGLEERLLKVKVNQLSGGEMRRFSLLRAISVEPDYLILDEATSGLDLVSLDSVINVLEKYKREIGCGFLFITHDLRCAYRLSDRIIKMQNGRFVRIGINNNKRENYNDKIKKF